MQKLSLHDALGIKEKGIITCVGAGGKSSLLMSLGTEWKKNEVSFVLTTTTKMFYHQVCPFAVVISGDYDRGSKYVVNFIKKYGHAAWCKEWYGIKVKGLLPEWIDTLYRTGKVPYILVEGDGARHRLIKAPGDYEPVIPEECRLVVGILSLKAIGSNLSSSVAYRCDKVAKILGKQIGDCIEPEDLAILATHERGIFSKYEGKKVLVLTGSGKLNIEEEKENEERICKNIRKNDKDNNLRACVVTKGFGRQMKSVRVYSI